MEIRDGKEVWVKPSFGHPVPAAMAVARVRSAQGRHILVAVARYLHFPTERAAHQTADIARRLLRGGELHH